MSLKKILFSIFLSSLLLVTSMLNGHAQSANPTTFSYENRDRRVACRGESDYPHFSVHVPGTMNVVARTLCPNQPVWVSIHISKKSFWIFSSHRNITRRGFGKVTANLAMQCNWKKGAPLNVYIITVSHGDSRREYAQTGGVARLKC